MKEDTDGESDMADLWHDLRHALRTLGRSPGFTLLAAATLALGIGATTALWSVVHGVLLRPLPFPEPERLVRLYSTVEGGHRATVSPPDFVDWRRETGLFTRAAAMNATFAALAGEAGAERVHAAVVTPGFFETLGVRPVLGRAFVAAEEVPGRHRVAVLGNGLWRRRFGADPGVVGRTVRLDGESYEVVGVAPPGFRFPGESELWTARAFTPDDLTTQRGAHYLDVVARLAPGVTVEEAAAAMRALGDRLAAQYPESSAGWSATAASLHEALVGEVRRPLLLLLGAVGLVLLVACANVANLLLARAVGRRRETAVRAALGAGRGRLVRALLAESLVLAVLGGAGGLLLAWWGTALLVRLEPADLPRLDEVGIDGAVLAWTAVVALGTGLLFGLAPALHASRAADLERLLRDGGRGVVGGRAGGRARQALIAAEMALSVLLLAGAGLLLGSFVRLQRVDPGFSPEGVLTVALSLPDARYGEPDQPGRAAAFYEDLVSRVERLPGVEAAGAVFGLPLTGFSYGISFHEIDGRQPASPEEERSTQVRLVTPGYVRAMGMRLLAGRDVTAADRAGAPPVVLVNESAARLLWPGEDPLGHRFLLGTRFGPERAGGEVVGVVADIRHSGLDGEPQPEVYLPHAQNPATSMTLAVRAAAPESLVGPIRAEVAALDREVPLGNVRTMEQVMAESVARRRFAMLLLAALAGSALLLAAVGIYGVMAHAVGQRTHEIGLRLALGAGRGSVLGLIVRQGMAVALAGAAVGLVAALALARILSASFGDLLFRTSPTDAGAFLGAALVLAAAALLACWLPARRAARVDPMVALRAE